MGIDRQSAMWAYELGFGESGQPEISHPNPFIEFTDQWAFWIDGYFQAPFEWPRG